MDGNKGSLSRSDQTAANKLRFIGAALWKGSLVPRLWAREVGVFPKMDSSYSLGKEDRHVLVQVLVGVREQGWVHPELSFGAIRVKRALQSGQGCTKSLFCPERSQPKLTPRT